ncbi:MAG TPA: hypothetical protein VF904_09055 [Anaeromyxobacteraceae bacterium]
MRESTKESPVDRGEVIVEGRCQVCGEIGRTIAMPGAPPPNQFCERCAIEYAGAPAGDDDELAP